MLLVLPELRAALTAQYVLSEQLIVLPEQLVVLPEQLTVLPEQLIVCCLSSSLCECLLPSVMSAADELLEVVL